MGSCSSYFQTNVLMENLNSRMHFFFQKKGHHRHHDLSTFSKFHLSNVMETQRFSHLQKNNELVEDRFVRMQKSYQN